MADDVQDSAIDDFDVPDAATPDENNSNPAQADDAATQQSAAELPQDLHDALIHDGLPIIPGETELAASRRLSNHLIGKSTTYRRDTAKAKAAAEEASRRVQELQTNLRPILLEHHRREQAARLEEQVAQIPPRDSPEYPIWLQEEALRREEVRRQEDIRRMQAEQEQRANSEVQGQLAAIDNAGYQKVSEGLGLVPGVESDPEFTHAFEVFSQLAIDGARSYFPDASDAQIHEFVALSQQLDIRRAEANGTDIRSVMKSRLNATMQLMESRGLMTRTGRIVAAAGNGNGNGAATGNRNPDGTFRTAPAPTTAQRLAADAQAAQRRGPTAVPSSARPTQLAGALPDPSAFESDEDYADAVMAGMLGTEEQRVAPNRKTR